MLALHFLVELLESVGILFSLDDLLVLGLLQLTQSAHVIDPDLQLLRVLIDPGRLSLRRVSQLSNLLHRFAFGFERPLALVLRECQHVLACLLKCKLVNWTNRLI